MTEPQATVPFHQLPGPVFTDCCNHPPGSYLGSFYIAGDAGVAGWHDLYLYPNEHGLADDPYHVCIRYGDEDCEYHSPGSAIALLNRVTNLNIPAYHAAAALIRIDPRMVAVLGRPVPVPAEIPVAATPSTAIEYLRYAGQVLQKAYANAVPESIAERSAVAQLRLLDAAIAAVEVASATTTPTLAELAVHYVLRPGRD